MIAWSSEASRYRAADNLNVKINYIIFFLFLCLLRVADLYLTYRITPDLSMEWNPVVSYFGLSWAGFLAIQLTLVLVATFAYSMFVNRKQLVVDKSGLGLSRFVYHYFHGEDLSWGQWSSNIFRFPQQRYIEAHRGFIGFTIVSGVIMVSVFAIIHNILVLNEHDNYLHFVTQAGYVYFATMFIGMVVVSAHLFFMIEYNAYRRLSRE